MLGLIEMARSPWKEEIQNAFLVSDTEIIVLEGALEIKSLLSDVSGMDSSLAKSPW